MRALEVESENKSNFFILILNLNSPSFSMKLLFKPALLLAGLLFIGQGCVSLSSDQTRSGPAGMFVSVDQGEAWSQISLLPEADGVKDISGSSVYQLIEDPKDPKAMYWASRGEGLYYTYDDGKTWHRTSGPLSSGFVYGVSVNPQDSCIIYGTNGSRVYRTIDCNRNWTEVYQETDASLISSLAVDPFDLQKIYLVKRNGDILISRDAGLSWQVQTRLGDELIDIVADPQTPGRFYLTSRRHGIYRTDDGGLGWNSLEAPLSGFSGALEYRGFYVSPTEKNTLYSISTYGILKSEDAGESWESIPLITPPGSARIYAFAVNPQNDQEMYYSATINDRSTFYKTVDGGQNWITKKLPSAQLPTALRVHPEKSSWVYMGFTIPPQQ